MPRPPPHVVAAERSLALHRAVAQRLIEEPELLVAARSRVASWLRDGTVARPYAEAWAEQLARPLADVVAVLRDEGEQAAALRSVSPFAGVLDARTRWRILRAAAPPAER